MRPAGGEGEVRAAGARDRGGRLFLQMQTEAEAEEEAETQNPDPELKGTPTAEPGAWLCI